jgi:hypothetical protein
MIGEIKEWKDLTFLEQTLRDIRANKGLVCGECGKAVSQPGMCRECIDKCIKEIRKDFEE